MVKRAVGDKEGIDPELQRLIFSGRQLPDKDTVAMHSIKKEDTIHLTSK